MASTTTNPTASTNPTETEGEETLAEEEDGEEVISPVTKRIVLTKRTFLLVVFVIVIILAIATTVYTVVFHLAEFDYPPTESSEESLRNTLHGLISLTIVTLIGLFVLKFRITNLLIGMLYFFLLVLCIIFPGKGILYGIVSWRIDEKNTIQQFAVNPAIEHKLHNFWAAYQKRYSCCGTLEIDKIEDWPYFLNTTDFPATCCSKEQNNYAAGLGLNSKIQNQDVGNPNAKFKPELDPKTSYCGRGLARTRNKGLGFDKATLFKRPFSGFFLSLTKGQIGKMHSKFISNIINSKPETFMVDQLDFKSKEIETVAATDAFMKNWKTFYLDSVCNTVDDLSKLDATFITNATEQSCSSRYEDHPNDIAHPASMSLDKPIQSIGVILDISQALNICLSEGWTLETLRQDKDEKINGSAAPTAEKYCKKQVPEMKQNATTIGRELLQRLDYLTTYIYEFSEGKKKVHEGTWILWKIPTKFDPSEIYPFKLNANYLRVSNPDDRPTAEIEAKQMYYFSRGIAENIIIKSAIHEKSCEFMDDAHIPTIKSKLARDLNKRWRKSKPFSDWKNSEEGLGNFFLERVHRLMYVTIAVSSCDIICVGVIGFVFWQYYSRIKAEEYANLALPKEFEVLHLRRGSLIDERDIVKDTVKLATGRHWRVGPAGRGPSQPQRKGQPRVQRGGTGRVQPQPPGPSRR